MATFTKRIGAKTETISDKYNSHWSPTWLAESFTYGHGGQIGVFDEWQSGSEWYGGVRNLSLLFKSITIPQGATITSAKITFTDNSSPFNPTTIHYRLIGVDEDNTGDFVASPLSTCRTRTQTTAVVDWDATFTPSSGTTRDTPDLKDIIQEIVNRGGWSSGNTIGIYLYDDGTTPEYYYDYKYYFGSAGSAPLLTIVYAAASESRSPSVSPSPSPSRSPSLSGSESASPSLSLSLSPSSSFSRSPSLSPSPSASPSLSPSASASRSPSSSLSPSPSPVAPFMGLRVAKPGKNVLTTDQPYDLIFDSSKGTLKYFSKQSINIVLDGVNDDVGVTGEYVHNLGYYPFVEVFVRVYIGSPAGNYEYCPFYGAGATILYSANYKITTTKVIVYGMIEGISNSLWNFDFLVFIYKNNLALT